MRLSIAGLIGKGTVKHCLRTNIGKYSSVTIGKGSTCHLGNNITTRTNFHLISNGNMSIGDGCFFNHNCSITCLDSIRIGNNASFGNNLVIVDHDHDFREREGGGVNGFITQPITIGDNVWVGANVTILKGISIGNGSVVAAGSVVHKDIPTNCIYINGNVITIDK